MTPVVSVQLKKKLFPSLSISLPLIGLFVGTEAYFNQDDLIWNRLQHLKSDIFGTYCRSVRKKMIPAVNLTMKKSVWEK